MSARVVYFNGHLVAESEARVSIYDSSLVMGDMVYEVTRTCHHRPYRLRDHLLRLERSMAALAIDPGLTLAELEAVTLDTLARNLPTEADDVDWQIIHNVSRGPAAAFIEAFSSEQQRATVVVSCFPLVSRLAALARAYEQGLDLVVPAQRAVPGSLVDAAIKCRSRLHYQLANLEAHRRSPSALALLVDPDGMLTEGTSGNVFVVAGGVLYTPAVDNLLPGVTRDSVLRLAGELGVRVVEGPIALEAGLAADELFLTSTSIGIVHARSLEGQPIGGGGLGPITRRLRAALADEMGVDIAAQARSYADRLAARAAQ